MTAPFPAARTLVPAALRVDLLEEGTLSPAGYGFGDEKDAECLVILSAAKDLCTLITDHQRSQPGDLLHVVPRVNEMEFSPLSDRQWPDHRMRNAGIPALLCFYTAQHGIHLRQ